MTAITFDRLSYLEHLKAAGIPEAQARAHAVALDEALRDTVATKGDLTDLRTDLKHEIRELELRTRLFTMVNSIAIIGILSAIKYFG